MKRWIERKGKKKKKKTRDGNQRMQWIDRPIVEEYRRQAGQEGGRDGDRLA